MLHDKSPSNVTSYYVCCFFVVFLYSHHKNFHFRPPEEVLWQHKLKHCDKNSVFNVASILSMKYVSIDVTDVFVVVVV